MKRNKRTAIALILAAAFLAGSLAACGNVDGSAAAITINGETLSMGTANFWLRYQQANAYTTMVGYGLPSDNMWDTEYSTTSSDNRTYGEVTKENFDQDMARYVLARQHAEELGVTIPDDLKKQIETSAADAVAQNTEAFKKMGVKEENVREIFELLAIYNLIFDPLVEDTDREVSDEEAAQTTVTYARIARTAADENGNPEDPTEEQQTDWRDEMEALLAAVKESEDPATADMSALAEELAADAFVNSYSYGADDASLPQEVRDAAATLSDGQIYDGVVETEKFFYLVRLDAAFDKEATETAKESVIATREQENFSAKVQAWLDEAEITTSKEWEATKLSDAEIYELAPSPAPEPETESE